MIHGAGDDVAGCVNAHIAEQGPMTTTTWNVGIVDDVECGSLSSTTWVIDMRRGMWVVVVLVKPGHGWSVRS